MKPTALDHIALYVADRDEVALYACERLAMRVVDRTDRYTLIGPSAEAGKLTLFDPPGVGVPQPSQLVSVLLSDPAGMVREPLQLPGGPLLTFGTHELVVAGTPLHSVIGVTLRSADPAVYAAEYCASFGFEPLAAHPDVATVRVGSGIVTLVRERPRAVDQPMLFHLGLLVGSAREQIVEAERRGVRVLDVVDASNTLALFVDGPEQICLEYVEHKPEFALT